MKLGFIGTGKIASSVIEGINHSKINYKRIIVSPRNKKIAIKLKKKINKIIIAKKNQDVVEKSDWVFLSVTPTVGKKIIKDLNLDQIKTNYKFYINNYFISTKKRY